MRIFTVQWSSAGNAESGTVVVKANNIVEAQNKFWAWLQNRPVFEHMWNLTFQFVEVAKEQEVIE